MKHLLHFTIGPVQSFISQARKTKDLYAGSCILAKLCKAAITAAKAEGLVLMFPVLSDTEFKNIKSIPNRFVASLSVEKTDDELRKIGENIKDAVFKELKNIAEKSITEARKDKYKSNEQLANLNTESMISKAFDTQLEQCLDIQWLFIPYTEEKYHLAYRLIDKLMGAVKNTRTFAQYQYEENEYGERGRKCSLDGERNALFFGKGSFVGTKEKPKSLFQATNAIELSECPDVHLRKNEGLSAVSFVKRFYDTSKEGKDFPSIAEVALMHIVSEKLKPKSLVESSPKDRTEEQKQALNRFKDAFSQQKIALELLAEDKPFFLKFGGDFKTSFPPDEWQFLYEENINEENLKDEHQRHEVKRRFNDIKTAYKNSGKILCRYYAILAFDGDRMGKWLSGEYLEDKSKLKDFQVSLSEKLRTFAQKAAEIVVDPKGATIYAGGDDFLGFINLDSLFEVVNDLRVEFDKSVNQVIKKEFSLTDDFTFSAGITVAHYKTPLNTVLNEARAAQETAKNEGDRNAFAIKIMKHSGESNLVYHKWNLEAKVGDISGNLSFIGHIITALKNVHFSKTFIDKLNREMLPLLDKDGRMGNSISKAIRSELFEFELRRLVARACIVKRKEEETKEVIIQQMQGVLLSLAKSGMKDNDYVVSNFLETLRVCSFLNRNLSTNNGDN